jgi:hypothetical protein
MTEKSNVKEMSKEEVQYEYQITILGYAQEIIESTETDINGAQEIIYKGCL